MRDDRRRGRRVGGVGTDCLTDMRDGRRGIVLAQAGVRYIESVSAIAVLFRGKVVKRVRPRTQVIMFNKCSREERLRRAHGRRERSGTVNSGEHVTIFHR